MKLGGARKGKRLVTVLREREKREAADPSLKEQRVQQEKASILGFFEPRTTPKPPSTSSSMCMPVDLPTAATDAGFTPSAAPAGMQIHEGSPGEVCMIVCDAPAPVCGHAALAVCSPPPVDVRLVSTLGGQACHLQISATSYYRGPSFHDQAQQ
jgi:hypothetical protein